MEILTQILLAFVQAATEFLPISSSGHLALISNLISKPDLSFIITLHLASLIAVIIFTRKEIYKMITFQKKHRKLWLYLIIATIPAGLVGIFLSDFIESTFSSYLFLGIFFIFTGLVLILTKLTYTYSFLNSKNSLIIGLFQSLALFPGISRSGMTISSGLFSGIERETAVKFSFLLFIPLSIGAFILNLAKTQAYFSFSLIIPFLVTLIFSILFLNLLLKIVKKNYFWLFSFYCFLIGLISLILYLR